MAANPDNWKNENGFEFALFPAKTEKPECLIIVFHGVGDNAKHFDHIAQLFQDKIPGADVIALQAPERLIHPDLPPDQEGYTWFPFGGSVKPLIKTVLAHTFNRAPIVKKVESFAREQLKKRGLEEKNLSFVGFSMGAIVALQVGLSGKKEIASVASLAGALLPLTRAKSKPAVLLQMGEKDTTFNRPAPKRKKGLKGAFAAAADRFSLRHERTKARLQKKHIPFQEKEYPGQTHALPLSAWKDSAEFVKNTIKMKATAP